MEDQVSTQKRIQQEATKLFARQGFEGASVRDITDAAEVNVAAVNYHFGSKQGLLDSIISDRLTPINQQAPGNTDIALQNTSTRTSQSPWRKYMKLIIGPGFSRDG